MKYTSSNKPLVCMQTQSTCYKGTRNMEPKGILWHSTGANNPNLSRYVQPSDNKPSADTYSKEEWISVLGKNKYNNDWNHIEVKAGLNAYVGKLADGSVTAVQTMPWDFRPWGCGSGLKGSCNDNWIQFEICEDSLTNKDYFNAVYQEACELTAYLCKLYNINPKYAVTYEGIQVPTILCHADSYKLGLGTNHGDVLHWFAKYNKTMDDVRNDVAKLLDVQATTIKTYKIVVDIPVYASAADAKDKKNKKGTYAPGTYYIYNKYPDGVNGMFNISKDSSGASAGSWINPAENVAKVVEEEVVQKLYRVRTSWADAKSQKGAFANLASAKACCQSAGIGYKVFDWEGKEVYAYATPVEEVVVKKPVYELEYPETHKIIEKNLPAFDKEACTKAITVIKSNNPDFDVNIAKAFFAIAPKYSINPMRAISQSILETGWFKFIGSSVKPEQNNYCGLGATGNGAAGNYFDTIEDGVRAQAQHLFAYGCKDPVPENDTIIDPRFKYVTRGIAPYWEQLAGRWAIPGFAGDDPAVSIKEGTTYGQKINKIYNNLMAIEITNEDINKYFGESLPNEEPDDIINIPDIEIDDSNLDTDKKECVDKANFILGLLERVLKAIMKLLGIQ